MPVVPKFVRAVTHIKVAIMPYYPQCFAVIAHNIEHCGFGSTLPLEEYNRILPPGVIYPQFEKHCIMRSTYKNYCTERKMAFD